MQRERLEATQIQLQRRVLFVVRAARFLEFGIGLGPTFLPIKDDAIPERVASRQLFRFGLGCRPKRLVDFVALARVNAAEKIYRTRDNVTTGELESVRTNQDARTVKTIRHTEASRQLDWFAAGQKRRPVPIVQRRHNHGPGTDTHVHIALGGSFAIVRLAKVPKALHQVQRYSHGFVAVMCISLRKTEKRDDALTVRCLNVSARLQETFGRPTNERFSDLTERGRVAIFREVVFVGYVADNDGRLVSFCFRFESNVARNHAVDLLLRQSLAE